MIAALQSNPYMDSREYYNALTPQQQRDFLESLYTLLCTHKALIFSKFLQAHPYFESYLIERDCSSENLSFLASSYHIIHAALQSLQEYLPNIIFEDKSMPEPTLSVILYEPLSMSYRHTLTAQIQRKRQENLRFYFCTQDFLQELTLALQVQQYCQMNELHASFIPSLMQLALTMCASDIHLCLQDSKAVCLLRLDGILVNLTSIHTPLFAKISQKLKLLSQLDINEVRLPQDGHFKLENLNYKHTKYHCDTRLSFLPTPNGESIVMRIPHAESRFCSLDTLGLSAKLLEILKAALLAKSGFILVSGPTGSGKSTLLYNCLRFLHNGTKKIITIEDPIEQEISGITQCQVQEDLSFGFAKALKYILRQDPDIIMVGEIRDYDTLEIALRAALTGHLVLASIHANDCHSSVVRLLELGAKEYVLRATLRLVIAQRLVQTLCPTCKIQTQGKYYAQGCHACYGQGYSKRILLQEILDFRAAPMGEGFATLLEQQDILSAMYRGIPTLHQQSATLFENGIITYEDSLL